MRRRRGVRRFRAGKREHVWVATVGTVVNPTPASTVEWVPGGVRFLLGGDWARTALTRNQLEKGAVATRIIGELVFNFPPETAPTVAQAAEQLVWGIRKVDQDDVAALDSALDFFNEDWMQTGQAYVAMGNSIVATLTWADYSQGIVRVPIDIRVKRKLTTEDDLALDIATVFGSGAFGPSCNFYLRTLVTLP